MPPPSLGENCSRLPRCMSMDVYHALQASGSQNASRMSQGQVLQKAWGSIGAGNACGQITRACICIAHTPAQRLLLRDSKPLRRSHNRSFFRLPGAPRASLDLRFAFDFPPHRLRCLPLLQPLRWCGLCSGSGWMNRIGMRYGGCMACSRWRRLLGAFAGS